MQFELTVDTSKFMRAVGRIPGAAKYARREICDQLGKRFIADFIRKAFAGRPRLKNRTGNLRRSFGHQIVERQDGTQVLVRSNSQYAALQEHGGTVTPKRSKWLTIPVGPALTAAGVARGPARSFDLSFRPTKSPATALLVNAKGVVYFVLKKSAKVPPRLKMRASWAPFIGANITKIGNGVVSKMVRALNAGRAR